MRYDGKVVLEVKEILDYFEINHNKWNELRNFHETHSQKQAGHQRENLHILLPPRENT